MLCVIFVNIRRLSFCVLVVNISFVKSVWVIILLRNFLKFIRLWSMKIVIFIFFISFVWFISIVSVIRFVLIVIFLFVLVVLLVIIKIILMRNCLRSFWLKERRFWRIMKLWRSYLFRNIFKRTWLLDLRLLICFLVIKVWKKKW